MPSRAKTRRKSIKLAYASAALWSLGNGLTSGTLLYYLVLDLGARGLGLSLILALPALVGLLRMTAPWLVAIFGSAKRACIAAAFPSYSLLSLWVIVSLISAQPSNATLLRSLIVAVCVHQLLEYIAQAALYSWLAELVPLRVRGRFFGRRNMWQLAVLIPTLLGGGYFAQAWKSAYAASDPALQMLAYTIPIGLGSLALIASLVPLALIPAVTPSLPIARTSARPWRSGLVALAVPFRDGTFRTLLTYRGWFSVANGITQSAQNIFPYAVLGMQVGDMAVMRTTMQLGQLGLSPAVGRAVDRIGNRPILQACQVFTAASLLFFLFASPDSLLGRWLILGAFVFWSAYAGTNIALYNLMLKLPPRGSERTPYVAAHEAIGSVFFALSTIAGGLLLDYFGGFELQQQIAPRLTHFALLFGLGFVLRIAGLLLLRRIDEPGAARWSELAPRRSKFVELIAARARL